MISQKDEAEIHKIFDAFDKDGDGEITIDELKAQYKWKGEPLTEEEAKTMFEELDADNSGTISYSGNSS
jgi:calmodulin